MSDTIESLKEAEKEAMREGSPDRQVHRVKRQSGNLTGGLILIGVGTVFLLSQLTGFYLHNWWALFIFVPAMCKLNDAWHGYRAHGRLRHDARGALIGGGFMAMIALFFLFNLSWSFFWPLALILLGVGALLNGRS